VPDAAVLKRVNDEQMKIHAEITDFIESVDAYSRHRLTHKEDLAVLMQVSRDEGKAAVFDDLTFHAKYIHRIFGIMKRTPPDSDAYPKIAQEFRDGIEKVTTMMRTLMKEAPDDVKREFTEKFFSMKHESLENLLSVAYDLSWIKNWNIDHENKIKKK
jgi:hypothetical protein